MIRRTWPLLVTLAVGGCIAGTAIAGVPTEQKSSVVELDPTKATIAQVVNGQVVLPTTSVLGPVTTLATGVDDQKTPPAISIDLPTDPATTTIALSETPLATQPSVTVAAEPPPTTFAPPAAETPVSLDIPTTAEVPATPEAVDRATMRLVVANGDGRDLAEGLADKLYGIGYRKITVATAASQVQYTTIYYRDGFNRAASLLGTDLGTEDATLLEYPVDTANPLTNYDDLGDVIVLLGSDIPG